MSSLSHVSWSSTPEKIEDIYLNDAAEEGVTDETVIGRCIHRSGRERESGEIGLGSLFNARPHSLSFVRCRFVLSQSKTRMGMNHQRRKRRLTFHGLRRLVKRFLLEWTVGRTDKVERCFMSLLLERTGGIWRNRDSRVFLNGGVTNRIECRIRFSAFLGYPPLALASAYVAQTPFRTSERSCTGAPRSPWQRHPRGAHPAPLARRRDVHLG